MKVISINTLCGLHNMLYDKKNLNKKIDVENNFLDINNLFWSQVLSHETIRKTINNFVQISSILGTLSIQEQYVVSAPNTFINKLTEAKNNIIHTEIDEKTLFSYIETLNIFCMIYNKLLPTNFTFTIDQGFHRSSSSAKEMLEHCLLEYSNPYLHFIMETVLPIILNWEPDIIFMKGIPNIGSFAIAKLVKQKLPKVHISITNHSTEYYSINKIKNNLSANIFFFECFDSVVLNQDYTETEKEIVNLLSKNSTLSDVPNILYKDYNGSVNVTNTKITYPKYDFNMSNIFHKYVNIRLFPKNHCYWNQCTFCGINNKYLDYSATWNIEDAWCQISYLENKNINYFWSIDEAIPPSILYQLAQKMNNNNCNFIWHTRSRLDPEWINEDIIKELAISGLTQIRLGFESASIRILKLMNKHENVEEVMDNIEAILELFFKHQIRVHFPAIIGFPTETIYEREQTINYLKKLKKKYPLFSYNVNILELDIR
jgi:Fe-S oxidoreductase